MTDKLPTTSQADELAALVDAQDSVQNLRKIIIKMTAVVEAHVKLCVLALQMQRAAEIRCGLPWAQIAHALRALKAVQYRAGGQSIVQRTKIAGTLAELLKKPGIPIPKQLLAVAEASETPVSA